MEDNEIAILQDNVIKSIESMLEEKKLIYISDTDEFIQGLLIGLEIAGIYGDDIKAMCADLITHNESD